MQNHDRWCWLGGFEVESTFLSKGYSQPPLATAQDTESRTVSHRLLRADVATVPEVLDRCQIFPVGIAAAALRQTWHCDLPEQFDTHPGLVFVGVLEQHEFRSDGCSLSMPPTSGQAQSLAAGLCFLADSVRSTAQSHADLSSVACFRRLEMHCRRA